jgi:hypothetical protein
MENAKKKKTLMNSSILNMLFRKAHPHANLEYYAIETSHRVLNCQIKLLAFLLF